MEQSGNILLVDDNDDDAFFVEKAFKTVGASVHIFRCIDGRETQKYLHANCFLTKPSAFDETVELARAMQHCWLRNIPTPPAPEP
jgi:hypothetical protein